MIYLWIILFSLSASLFAYEEYCEWMENKDPENRKLWDKKEHNASFFHRLSLLLVGFLYPFGIKEILLCVVIYWMLTDGLMNLLKKRNFFAISEDSGSMIEKYSTWYVKISLLIIAIFWSLI